MNKMIKIIQMILISSIIISAQSFSEKATQIILKTPNGDVAHDMSRHHVINYNKSTAQDGYGRPTEFQRHWWNPSQTSWDLSYRSVHTYAQGYTGPMCGGYPGYSGWSTYTWNGTSWGNPYVTTPTYDPSWNMTGWTSTAPGGSPYQEGTLTGPYCCGYPTQEVVRGWNGSTYDNYSRYSNTFNSDCDWTREQIDSWDGSGWVPITLWESTYTQPGCPDVWTVSYWYNGEWVLSTRTTFTYGNSDCMSDQVPYPPWYLGACNPTTVDRYTSSDNGNTWGGDWREVYNLSGDCQATTIHYYPYDDGNTLAPSPDEIITNEFKPLGPGKVLEILDNSDNRVTTSVSQVFTGGVGTNNWRAWNSYEELQLNTDNELSLPDRYFLAQNYPNPFNPYTTILYELPAQAKVSVVIYDFLGREVRNLVNSIEQPGSHSVNWNGKDGSGNDVSAGIYLYRIQAGGYVETKKMVLLK
ncbi:MAG: T9SS type A sorting domain-containing protein [Candidatus Neomarinimicrobiota bacterium]